MNFLLENRLNGEFYWPNFLSYMNLKFNLKVNFKFPLLTSE